MYQRERKMGLGKRQGKKTKNKSSGALSSWGVVSGAAGFVTRRWDFALSPMDSKGTAAFMPLRNDFQ